MRIRYDNSAANPRNPNHPPKLVLTGNRSEDEMGHVWLQFCPKPSRRPDPRLPFRRRSCVGGSKNIQATFWPSII